MDETPVHNNRNNNINNNTNNSIYPKLGFQLKNVKIRGTLRVILHMQHLIY